MKKIIPSSFEKPGESSTASKLHTKFILGGLLIALAVFYLIYSSTRSNAQYYMTIEEIQTRRAGLVGQDIRISGVALGDTIVYDAANNELAFTVVNVPGTIKEIEAQGGMAAILSQARANPDAARLEIIHYGVKPDLLKDGAHAIMSGSLDEDGVFTANELLLKCPSRYEETENTLAEVK